METIEGTMKISVPLKSVEIKEPASIKEPRIFPTLYLDEKQSEECCACEVGDQITMFVSAKVVSKSQRDGEPASVGLEVQKIGLLERSEGEDEDESED